LLAQADEQVEAGALVGPNDDDALDLLLQAHSLSPEDERAARRLEILADSFERLGADALDKQDYAEAATYFQAVVKARPGRTHVAARLHEVEELVRRGPNAEPTETP
jgi:hypothetical protein